VGVGWLDGAVNESCVREDSCSDADCVRPHCLSRSRLVRPTCRRVANAIRDQNMADSGSVDETLNGPVVGPVVRLFRAKYGQAKAEIQEELLQQMIV